MKEYIVKFMCCNTIPEKAIKGDIGMLNFTDCDSVEDVKTKVRNMKSVNWRCVDIDEVRQLTDVPSVLYSIQHNKKLFYKKKSYKDSHSDPKYSYQKIQPESLRSMSMPQLKNYMDLNGIYIIESVIE